MKQVSFSKLTKGDLFKENSYSNSLLEFQFFVPNEGGYGAKKNEGYSAYVIKKEGFAVSLILICRKSADTVLLIEEADRRYLSEVEDRIRQTAKFVELYAAAERNSANENLVGTYSSSAQYGPHAFQRGDLVKDLSGRIGTVLGVDGHSITQLSRVDYRVQVFDCGKRGVGIFRADEITKVGKLDNVNDIIETA